MNMQLQVVIIESAQMDVELLIYTQSQITKYINTHTFCWQEVIKTETL